MSVIPTIETKSRSDGAPRRRARSEAERRLELVMPEVMPCPSLALHARAAPSRSAP